MAEAGDDRIGTVLDGTYRLDRLLAGGGCGDVYVATHVRLGSEVAVKVLLPSLAGNAEALDRLRREADIMSRLQHPHIVQILDFNVTEQGVPFIVMELLVGWPLTGRTASGPPFEPRAALHIVRQIAQALAAAHARGVAHLDLKPDNVVLIPTDGRGDFVKVIDFGISQATWRDRLAHDPLISGTPEYMAPEQAGGLTDEIDHRADQFSLASLSYRLLTGHEPFSGADPLAILHQVIGARQPPPSRWAPGLGVGVDAVIDRGLSKRPEARYPDIMAFADALRAAVAADGR
jgi:serine/threonine protein kinase